MIGAVVQIIFAIILLGVIWWAVQQILPHIPMGEPFRTIVRVLMVVLMVVICLWVIWQLLAIAGIVSGGRPFRIGGEPGGAVAAFPTEAAGHLSRVLKFRSYLTADTKIIPRNIPAFCSHEQFQWVVRA